MVMTTRSTQRTSAPSGPVHRGFRPDIQGLRAVAVLVVISDHLFGWPSGGFVGVDVFFVISGFLITGLMVREHERTGRISWIGFYRRRVKRIMPAATVVLLFTVACAYILYRASRFWGVAADAFWSFVFLSNWHFAASGTDYLAGDGPVSPLQHFWSLSVEEQFYILWPIILISFLGIVGRQWGRSGRSVTRLLCGTLAIAVALSFIWAVIETANNPTWAYFSTFSRVWELATGAGLAVGVAQLARIPSRVRPYLCYLGLAGIGASLFLITTTSAFPGPWAALPVAAAALVIAAGAGGTSRGMWPLTNPASVYVGNISYSLYLWHFPVIVLLATLVPHGSLTYDAWAIALVVVLSVASFHLVENPIRNSAWLAPDRKRSLPPRNTSHRSRPRTAGLVLLWTWSAAVVVAAVVVAQVKGIDAAAGAAPRAVPDAPVDPGVSAAQAQLTANINAALSTADWPDLSPSLDALGRPAMAPEWMTDGCLGGEQSSLPDPQQNAERCVYGDPAATKTAILLGDSVAISWLPGIRAALPSDYRIRVLTFAQCPVADMPVTKVDGSPFPECADFRKWSLDQVVAAHPDLVVMSESPIALKRIEGQPDSGVALGQWVDGLTNSLSRLSGNAGRVVMLAPPPGTGTRNLDACDGALSSPNDCIFSGGDLYHSIVQAGSQATTAKGFTFVPTEPWFCVANRCPSFVGTTPVFADPAHITAAFSRQLAPVLGGVLTG